MSARTQLAGRVIGRRCDEKCALPSLTRWLAPVRDAICN